MSFLRTVTSMFFGVLLTTASFLLFSPDLRRQLLADAPQEVQATLDTLADWAALAAAASTKALKWFMQDSELMQISIKPYHVPLILLYFIFLLAMLCRWCCSRQTPEGLDKLLEEDTVKYCSVCEHELENVDHSSCMEESNAQSWTDRISKQQYHHESEVTTRQELQAAGLWVQHATITAEQRRQEEEEKRRAAEKQRKAAEEAGRKVEEEARHRASIEEANRQKEAEKRAQDEEKKKQLEAIKEQEESDALLARQLAQDVNEAVGSVYAGPDYPPYEPTAPSYETLPPEGNSGCLLM
eukprot:gb/GEZN01008409.1/.p1 GENE.gb/GEZN01008409.1/~~gb/GEZN01008409.1/.p1  ORF type:complete len:298 (-),score=61.77 gb/GEZN01008409.1/:217-1110(-)